MSIKHTVQEWIGSEQILLLIFLTISTYMFIESYTFTGSYIFPRYSALVMMLFAIMMLGNHLLPESIRRITTSSGGLESYATESVDKSTEQVESPIEDDPVEEEQSVEPNMKNAWITIGLMSGYVVFSYLFGMMWMTPLFVVAYTYQFDQPIKVIVVATVIATMFAYLFTTTLVLPLDEGILWEGPRWF
ncbi:tripartite tricarboxylate transporter TctB family protein [Natrarchaeobius chitinivorans]|uniref:DUF1468 domain-containing protein n=1 Tax=Natrarchaeobius chitinivorans TaxID=1679083 RepID=A0A3N6LXC6_NATCH|nr:tripartite tricarboxylate transporter TctB family protein [Natrarchaeobius chitinivorans]RQG95418.1 hypothetical protein EA473_08110 [Natrarchaeobius chitinivorans]